MLINVYATHKSPPEVSFPHRLVNRRDLRDPELQPHLSGFMGFVMDRGKRPMTATRYAIIRHLERVRHHLALEVAADQMNAFEAWAREVNALVFLPDGTVRAPDGRVLVAPDTGDPQPGAEVPFPADAMKRKAATEAALSARGVTVPKSLPPVISEVEVDLRDAKDVATRCLALLACAVRAESLASGDPLSAAELAAKIPLALSAVSPKERAFMAAEDPAQQDVVDHVWRYEALASLGWAVGVLDAPPFPNAIVDVPALAKKMFALDGASFVATARLREAGELLDALDLTFRLHWATTDARVKKAEAPAGLEGGVIAERHYALNWLTRFEDAEWDDVTTPT